jgi:dihydroorotate dehydrogenase electron transfer subunit
MTQGAQWRAKVLARRRTSRYTVLTVSAPGVADRCRPGQFVSVSVAQDSAMLMRRQVWIGTSSASGRDGGAIELAIDSAEPGGQRLAAADQGAWLDVIGPLGRPFSLPRTPVAALVAGSGTAAAPLIWLAAELGARGSRVRFLYLPGAEPFGLLEAKRVCVGVTQVSLGQTAESVQTHLAQGFDVLYSAGPPHDVAEVAAAAGATPHQTALQTPLVCAAATCTACVVPLTGRDGVTRMVRACAEGAVFNAGLVRWADLGTIPVECQDVGP